MSTPRFEFEPCGKDVVITIDPIYVPACENEFWDYDEMSNKSRRFVHDEGDTTVQKIQTIINTTARNFKEEQVAQAENRKRFIEIVMRIQQPSFGD